jgi:hypothetical protein
VRCWRVAARDARCGASDAHARIDVVTDRFSPLFIFTILIDDRYDAADYC